MRTCSQCHTEKPEELMQKRGSWCKACCADMERARRRASGIQAKRFTLLREGEKRCGECETWKPLTDFNLNPRGSGGRAAYCKSCQARKFPHRDKAKARAATNAYRRRHSARWKAMHRVNQYNRRMQQNVTNDGTVTDELLLELYARVKCHFCPPSKRIPQRDRTVEHLTPLKRGGAHSATNLTMTCRSCNSSKGKKTEQEFIEYRNNKRHEQKKHRSRNRRR